MLDVAEAGRAERVSRERMSLQDYLGVVEASPAVARSAHKRVYDMIMAAGTETKTLYGREVTTYKFFSGQLFGIEETLEEIIKYFASAAQGLDIRRRILLLVGPVASAKSTILTILKRGYEAYTRTDEGAMYGIVGCPHHEEPLNAVPARLRPQLPVSVEGTLCPYCQTILDEEFGGDFSRFEVERIFADEAGRVAIGTFAPGEPLTQTSEDVVGGLDLSKISKYGSESDARAYRFDGAANIASRGIFEVVEALKIKSELLHIFLTLAQERMVKAGRFPLFFVDSVIVMHTNEAELSRFAGDRKNEAIQNRMYVVKVPYNLRLHEEIKIYEKMVNESSLSVHIAPHLFETVSRWSVLTRMGQNDRYTLLTKLRVYDEDYFGDFTSNDIHVIRDAFPTDGMFGVSPRQVNNAIAQASVSTGESCVNSIDALRAIRNTLSAHIQSDPRMAKATLEQFVTTAMQEYATRATKEVQRAYISSFDDVAQNLLRNYLDNAEHSIDRKKMRDPITGEFRDPDDKLMRAIEEQIGVAATQAVDFRREVLMRVGEILRRGDEFRWDSHERLKDAIERKLFSDLSATIKLTTSSQYVDKETQKRIDDVVEVLKGRGYCDICARKTISFVGTILNK